MTADPTAKVAIAANSAWYILNFRDGLVRALQDKGYQPIVIAPADPAVDGRMPGGIERIAFKVDRSGTNPLADLRLLWSYASALRRSRPVALLSFTVKPNIYGAIAGWVQGVPAIPTVSGLGTVFIGGGLLKRFVTLLYKAALRRSPAVLFENSNDRDLFVAAGIVEEGRCKVVPGSGINLSSFCARDLPAGAPTFLLIARLLGDKGVREYVEAARGLRESHPGWRFQLLGALDPGNRTAISRQEIEAWSAEGVVDYLGETADVRPYIAAASVVVLPSYREGLPKSLLEGAAMGRPLVATDVPGCRELVAEGVNGFLCDARSAGSLAGAMRKMGKCSPQRQAEMGQAGRRMVEARFDERIVVGEYLALLEAVCARNAAIPQQAGLTAP